MKEKKLTDEEIVRALECCIQNETENTCAYCIGCPASDWDSEDDLECNADMMKKSIDLIHRQKAEIERLTEERHKYFIKATLYYAICKGYGIDNFYDKELEVANKDVEVE